MKIHFIYAIPFIFISFVLIGTSSHPVTASFFFSHHNGVVSPSTLLIVIFCFFGGGVVRIAHECDHSLGSLLTYELLCSAIIFLPYNPPQKPASGLVLCGGYDAINGDRSCSNTTHLSPLLAAGGPPIKSCPRSLYDGAMLIVTEDGNTRGI